MNRLKKIDPISFSKLRRLKLAQRLFLNLSLLCLFMSTVALSVLLTTKYREASQLAYEKEAAEELAGKLALMIPNNSASWWLRGCEDVAEQVMSELGPEETNASLSLLVIRTGCLDRAKTIETQLTQRLQEEVFRQHERD